PGTEVERQLRGDHRGDRRRPRGRKHAAAEGAARLALSGREEARPRRGLHLPARQSRGVRRRLPPRRAEGQEVLPAVRDEAVTLNRYEWGEGEPVVCLHGVTSYGGRFDWLAGSGRRVVAPDLLGPGHPPWDPPWAG